MFNINVAGGKVELTSEDGTEVVSLRNARYGRGEDGLWVDDYPTIQFSKNLTQRIIDAVFDTHRSQ